MVRMAVLLVAMCACGCADKMATNIMDSAAANHIKVMEAKAKIDKERRQDKYSIEGEIKSVVMGEKEVPDPDVPEVRKQEGKVVTYEKQMKKVKVCTVTFADGRVKEFNEVPSGPLDAKKYYKIEYNGMGEIVQITLVK